jgi:hypothetical protein
METQILEAEAVEVGAEIVPGTDANLFRKDDPVEALNEATRVSTALAEVVTKGGMIDRVSGKDYVKVEGWRTLGAILGVSPQEIAMVELENGWQCTVEAVTSDGRCVGRATSSCTTDESRWKNAKTFELQGMASTRATSRALRAPLGFVMQLAGFQATSAEEMSEVAEREGRGIKEEDYQWDVLPPDLPFLATCLEAKWVNAKGKDKIVMIAAVANSNGGKSAAEKLWLEPGRPDFAAAVEQIGKGNGGEPKSDLEAWIGQPFDLTVSLNGKWRNYAISPATPLEVS